jgi:maltooligosyltrehalose trehalohydrolase
MTITLIPLQGEEGGASTPFQYFTDHDDPELGRAVREGRRASSPVSAGHLRQSPTGKTQPRLRARNWIGESAREPHAGLFAWHRRLIRLRRMIPALAEGRMDQVRVHGDEHARWLTVERAPLIVACNLAGRVQRVPIGREHSSAVLLTSDPMIELKASGAALPPDSVVVLGPAEPYAEGDAMGTDLWGIDEGYEDALGVWRETPAATRSALLAALGVDPAQSGPPLEPPVRVLPPGPGLAA